MLDTDTIAQLPGVRVYQHKEEIIELVTESLDNRDKAIYYLGEVENLIDFFTQEFDEGVFISSRVKNGIFLQMVLPEGVGTASYIERDARELRHTKVLPERLQMDTSIMIWDDTTVFFSSKDNFYAFVIQAPEITRMMKIMFRDIWDRIE